MNDFTLINLNLFRVRYATRVHRVLHVPLGPLYLTAALERAGLRVDLRDYQTYDGEDPFSLDAFRSYADAPAPVVGFSCMANLLPFTLLAMLEVRRAYPDRVLVLGGTGAKGIEADILRRFPWVDVIVRGEAELSAPLLLAALGAHPRGDLARVPGISWREGATVRSTSAPPRIQELDALPPPAYHHLDWSRFDAIDIIGSRGCRFACTFCAASSIWNHQMTGRSPGAIVAEMNELHRLTGIRQFLFQDDLFTSSRERVLAFCAALGRSGLALEWKALARIDLVDEEVLEAMAGCGCIDIRFGIESGSTRLRRHFGKDLAEGRTERMIRIACGLFPRVDLFFVWGEPSETMEEFHRSVFQMLAYRAMGANIVPLLFAFSPAISLFRGVDPARLEFVPGLFGDQLVTGHEVFEDGEFRILPQHQYIYDLIRAHPDLFPGFFHLDAEHNALPKRRVLQEFGFYPGPASCSTPDT